MNLHSASAGWRIQARPASIAHRAEARRRRRALRDHAGRERRRSPAPVPAARRRRNEPVTRRIGPIERLDRPGSDRDASLVSKEQSAPTAGSQQISSRYRDRKKPDRHHDEAYASEQLANCRSMKAHAGVDVGADDAEQKSHGDHSPGPEEKFIMSPWASTRGREGDQAHQHREKYRRARRSATSRRRPGRAPPGKVPTVPAKTSRIAEIASAEAGPALVGKSGSRR